MFGACGSCGAAGCAGGCCASAPDVTPIDASASAAQMTILGLFIAALSLGFSECGAARVAIFCHARKGEYRMDRRSRTAALTGVEMDNGERDPHGRHQGEATGFVWRQGSCGGRKTPPLAGRRMLQAIGVSAFPR